MTTLRPRPPYTDDELSSLYPQQLQLQQVNVLLRHGERTPTTSRFRNAGLAPYWPYCAAANQLRSIIQTSDASWDGLTWKRRLETFGDKDAPTLTTGSRGEVDGVCLSGELTDRGQETTLALGQRLRHLYVHQLGFLPNTLSRSGDVTLRSTPIPRALASVQHTFTGLYPPALRASDLAPPVVVSRSVQDETLFPNDSACKRFGELSRAFADRTAKLYNDGPELAYVNKKLRKWMPPLPGDDESKPQQIKVNSHPRLTGIMDTVFCTLAHGPATKLPPDFYDPVVVDHVQRICTEEWFVGYQESREYRKLGIGALVGDITQRMVEYTGAGRAGAAAAPEDLFKLSLSGCHDTTLAATLTALGAFDATKDNWPSYSSSVVFELFRRRPPAADPSSRPSPPPTGALWPSKERTWWYSLFSSPKPVADSTGPAARKPLVDMSPTERERLDGYFVRLRYNDTPVTLPYCRQAGRHLDGDESFCTLSAFKAAADSFTPKNWKQECGMNLGQPAMGAVLEPPPGM